MNFLCFYFYLTFCVISSLIYNRNISSSPNTDYSGFCNEISAQPCHIWRRAICGRSMGRSSNWEQVFCSKFAIYLSYIYKYYCRCLWKAFRSVNFSMFLMHSYCQDFFHIKINHGHELNKTNSFQVWNDFWTWVMRIRNKNMILDLMMMNLYIYIHMVSIIDIKLN